MHACVPYRVKGGSVEPILIHLSSTAVYPGCRGGKWPDDVDDDDDYLQFSIKNENSPAIVLIVGNVIGCNASIICSTVSFRCGSTHFLL